MIRFLRGYLNKRRVIIGLFAVGIIASATAVFILRNNALYRAPNFYAEDATIFLDHVVEHPFTAIFTLFNGYLVVGQYLILYAAILLNFLTGGSIADMPLCIAILSALFLGICVSLPYILFRKQLGTWLSLLAVAVGAFVPMANSSFTIIGTIGNLKFTFVYLAFMLILYRNVMPPSRNKAYLVDAVLLICVLTNLTAAFLLPFALWPYRLDLMKFFKMKNYQLLLKQPGFVSITGVQVLSLIYIVFVYVHGIPPLPGYLDAPYQSAATLPIADRATTYTWLYPITDTFRARVVIGILAITAAVAWINFRKDRFILIFAIWAIAVSTILFVINRTGVSAYFLDYHHNGGPDQFFYAQNLTFVFLTFWLARGWFNGGGVPIRVLSTAGVAVFLLWAAPYGTTLGQAAAVYKDLGTAEQDIRTACMTHKKTVKMQIYPSKDWKWTTDRDVICKK